MTDHVVPHGLDTRSWLFLRPLRPDEQVLDSFVITHRKLSVRSVAFEAAIR
jgi:hypothetical protein